MRRLVALGALGLVLFEAANVYFIMPLPGSQRTRSIELAYALYQARWIVRVLCLALIAAGLRDAWQSKVWRYLVTPVLLLVAGGVSWMVNTQMQADQIFKQPNVLTMAPASANAVAQDRLVVGIAMGSEARAYPLQYIGYHHHLRDSIAGRQILVSYCTVCRTGRIFAPIVDGKLESFRLVGMDHFNAMLEDETTGSWWRQANGEAIAGSRMGTRMEELPSRQTTLARWLALYPNSLVMQADPAFTAQYDKDYAYERGTSRKRLTGTDTASWNDKSWVVGVTVGPTSRAYDWNHLERVRVVNDTVNGTPIVLALAADSISFFAFVRPDTTQISLDGDSLVAGSARWAFNGQGSGAPLVPLNASQEFWHSWRTFQPSTGRFPATTTP